MKLGFIGLGMMGSGMARNLIKAGNTLIVFNRTRSRAQEMAQLGATVAATWRGGCPCRGSNHDVSR
jgi:3-hydroxyisobutyrate dehydrogenase-like beta-hydroxyacid dehydrogenase